MNNFSFLYLTDTHFWDRVPEGRQDDYQSACLSKLSEVVQIAKNRGCLFVLHGGDLFMVSRPASFPLMSEVFSRISRSGVLWLFNVGNHDLTCRRRRGFSSTGLGLLSLCPNTHVLPHDRVINLGKLLTHLGRQGGSDRMLNDVLIHVHWFGSDVDRRDSPGWGYRERESYPKPFLIRAVHGMLLDAKGPFGEDQTLLKGIETRADIFLGSHYHPGWGPTRSDRTLFVHPGSLLRWPRPQYNRTPSVAVFDVYRKDSAPWEVRCQIVRLKSAKPMAEVFELKRKRMKPPVSEVGITELLKHLPAGMDRMSPDSVMSAVLTMAEKRGMTSALKGKLLSVLEAALKEVRR